MLSIKTDDQQFYLNQLITDANQLFNIINQRHQQYPKIYTLPVSPQLNLFEIIETNKKLNEIQDQFREKYQNLAIKKSVYLKSFLVRFGCRLKQIYQRLNNKMYYEHSKHLKNLENAITNLFQTNEPKLQLFFSALFSFHRQEIEKSILKIKAKNQKNVRQKSKNLIDINKSIKKPSFITILPSNQDLYKAWRIQGKRNYKTMEVDCTLQQIFYFTRDKQQNSQLMYKDLLQRNKDIETGIKKYGKSFKSFKNGKNLRLQQYNHSMHNTRTIKKDVTNLNTNRDRDTKQNNINKNMFRIRFQDKKVIKQRSPCNKIQLNELNLEMRTPKYNFKTNTINIQFKNLKTTVY